jgi:SAM-dependent methyltransferase
MHSPPKDMGPFYKGGYEPIPATVSELKMIAASEKYRVEPILRHKRSGRFLEIGPWRGVFCCNMKDAGFQVSAIEMNMPCVEFLRNQLGIEAIQSSNPAETMKNLKPGFDVIAAWHSLEHLPEPWLVIKQAARLLAPGGILLIAMPNPESYEFSVMKASWMHLDAPRHLYLFPIKSLLEICETNRLRPLEITTADTFSQIQSKQAWQAWARSWIPIRYIRGVIAISIGNLLYWRAYKQQITEGRGSGYTAVFEALGGEPS